MMKHITEEYNHKVNRLRINSDDYKELQAFLNEIGVEIRMTEMYRGECTIQVRNVHAEECMRTGGLEAYKAAKIEAQEVIKKGWWRR